MQNRKKAVALNYDGANAPIVTAVGMGIIADKILENKVTFGEIKNTIRNTVSQYMMAKTHRNPMVIPLVMNKL